MENNEDALKKTNSFELHRLTDRNHEDDTEDYIQPSQPLSFQSASLESVNRKMSDDNPTEMSLSTIDETLPVPRSLMVTPDADSSHDFIPSTENPLKRKQEEATNGACKKKLDLDDTNQATSTQDIFSTQTQLDDTIDASHLQIPGNHLTQESQNEFIVPESPLRVNETAESDLSDAHLPRQILEETPVEDLMNATPELVELDSSANRQSEPSICEIRDQTGNSVDVQVVDPISSVSRRDGLEMVTLDETIDAEDIEFYRPCSREKSDIKSVNQIPSVTDRLTSPDTAKTSGEGTLGLKAIAKNISEEKTNRKYSTPENPMSKSLNINESTSSIENGTPPVDEKLMCRDVTFTILLQVDCQMTVDPLTRQALSKKILNVKELSRKQLKPPFREPLSDSSNKTKRLSSSSAGSVYSDKTGLPYPLPNKPPLFSAERSSGSSLDLEKVLEKAYRQPWDDESLLGLAMDKVIPRYVEHEFSKPAARRRTLLRSKKKDGWNHLDVTCITEPSSETSSDVQLPRLKNFEISVGGETTQKAEKEVSEETVKPCEETEENKPVDAECEEELVEGLLVFARWTDKRYYPGKLVNSVRYNRWEVEFDDGTSKVIREDLILPLKWLTKGELVFAMVEEKYFSGKITEIIRDEQTMFRVELDDSNEGVVVRKSDLCLNDVMAGIIREKYKPMNKPSTSTANIDFDNVVTGKRVREQRTPIRGASTTSQPGSSTIKKREISFKVVEETSEDSDKPKSKTSVSKAQSSTRKRREESRTPDSSSSKKVASEEAEISGKKPRMADEGSVRTPRSQRKAKGPAKKLMTEFEKSSKSERKTRRADVATTSGTKNAKDASPKVESITKKDSAKQRPKRGKRRLL